MSTFPLEILTPKERFYQGDAESVLVSCTDGELVIQKNHQPMYAALRAGVLTVTDGDGRHTYNASEGFVTVHPDHVVIFLMKIRER